MDRVGPRRRQARRSALERTSQAGGGQRPALKAEPFTGATTPFFTKSIVLSFRQEAAWPSSAFWGAAAVRSEVLNDRIRPKFLFLAAAISLTASRGRAAFRAVAIKVGSLVYFIQKPTSGRLDVYVETCPAHVRIRGCCSHPEDRAHAHLSPRRNESLTPQTSALAGQACEP